MKYLTDLNKEHYDHLKESRKLLIKTFDWKVTHCNEEDKKCLQSRIAVIRKIELELHKFERQFEFPMTKSADLSFKAAQERMLIKEKDSDR